MSHIKITLSISPELGKDLRFFIPKGEISSFVSKSLRKALDEKKQELAEQYEESSKDPGFLEGKKDWETIGEQVINEDW